MPCDHYRLAGTRLRSPVFSDDDAAREKTDDVDEDALNDAKEEDGVGDDDKRTTDTSTRGS